MSQHELGITFVSLRQLQGSTSSLRMFVKITLSVAPETMQEEHWVTKYVLLLMKGLEQWCFLKGLSSVVVLQGSSTRRILFLQICSQLLIPEVASPLCELFTLISAENPYALLHAQLSEVDSDCWRWVLHVTTQIISMRQVSLIALPIRCICSPTACQAHAQRHSPVDTQLCDA